MTTVQQVPDPTLYRDQHELLDSFCVGKRSG